LSSPYFWESALKEYLESFPVIVRDQAVSYSALDVLLLPYFSSSGLEQGEKEIGFLFDGGIDVVLD
jgi:hypothetical protein